MKNFDLRKYLANNPLLTEGYTLRLKNNHPKYNVDKKIEIDFKPTTLFGGWDAESLEDTLDKEGAVSGTELELLNSSGEVIKKGYLVGYKGNTPIINKK